MATDIFFYFHFSHVIKSSCFCWHHYFISSFFSFLLSFHFLQLTREPFRRNYFLEFFALCFLCKTDFSWKLMLLLQNCEMVSVSKFWLWKERFCKWTPKFLSRTVAVGRCGTISSLYCFVLSLSVVGYSHTYKERIKGHRAAEPSPIGWLYICTNVYLHISGMIAHTYSTIRAMVGVKNCFQGQWDGIDEMKRALLSKMTMPFPGSCSLSFC